MGKVFNDREVKRLEPVLEVNDVTAGYEEGIDILHDISLEIGRNALTGMIGLNGAGKTTLCKTIYGFLSPKEGTISYKGDDITETEPHNLIQRGFWYLPQDSSLFPFLSVKDNLKIPAQSVSLAEGEKRDRIKTAFERFPELKEKENSQAGDLSGGQQKMLECAKVSMVKPEMLFVDEPTVGLAPKIALRLYDEIQQFRERGMTVFLIDHNVRKVIELTEYVYVMSLGKIEAEGAQEEFQGELKGQVKQWLGF